MVWTVPTPEIEPRAGPSGVRTPIPARLRPHDAGVRSPGGRGSGLEDGMAAFEALRRTLTPVRTPIADAWILTRDEPELRPPGRPPPRGSSRAATRTSCSREPIASSSSRSPSGARALDLTGVARRRPCGGRDSRHVAPRGCRADSPTWQRLSRAAPSCSRSRSGGPAVAWCRGSDRCSLGLTRRRDVWKTCIASAARPGRHGAVLHSRKVSPAA